MRIGFIGGYGHHYLRGSLTDPSCAIESIAVAGDGYDNAKAQAFSRSLPNARWFPSAEAMFDEFRPTAISVGTLYGYNSDFIAMALERNLPTVSDKPIAATWDQYRRLQSLTRDPRRIILTEFDFRCRPDFCAAKKAVEQGLIGDIALAVVQKSYRFGTRPDWYKDRQAYGGTLLWIASHGVDVIPFTTGLHFKKVTGFQGNVTRPDFGPSFEDHCIATFKLSNGGSAVVHADYSRPQQAPTHGDDRLRLAGSKGVVEVRGERCFLTTHDHPEQDITDQTIPLPIHKELLLALEGRSEKYNTPSSMVLAEILLHARDALDTTQFKELT